MGFLSALLIITLVFPTNAESYFLTGENSAPDIVDVVRPAVVQVGIKITDISKVPDIPASLAPCFRHVHICIIGSGFLVNDEGDIVTASHVANGTRGVQQFIGLLEANGIQAIPIIGVSFPNIKIRQYEARAGVKFFPAVLIATDAAHDIALYHATVNPFTNMGPMAIVPDVPGLPQAKAEFVTLDPRRPRDTEEIFACGFPFGDSGLVATLGVIASADKSRILISDLSEKWPWPVEVYWADLKINPGNSGGPIFGMKDHAVLGIAVQTLGSLGVVVPAKYIIQFLDARGIKFRAVPGSEWQH